MVGQSRPGICGRAENTAAFGLVAARQAATRALGHGEAIAAALPLTFIDVVLSDPVVSYMFLNRLLW